MCLWKSVFEKYNVLCVFPEKCEYMSACVRDTVCEYSEWSESKLWEWMRECVSAVCVFVCVVCVSVSVCVCVREREREYSE